MTSGKTDLWRDYRNPPARAQALGPLPVVRHPHSHKPRDHHIELGIIIASSGVTGDPAILRAANHKAPSAQTSGYHILLIIMDDILRLRTSDEFTRLLVKRLLGLAASDIFQMAGL
jgi:hypothetical protein